MSNRLAIHLFVLLALCGGCKEHTRSPQLGSQIPDYDSEWSVRNGDIYRFVIAKLSKPPTNQTLFTAFDEPPPDEPCFITTTPMAEWGETGEWEALPADAIKTLANASLYRPANEAHLADGHVLENGTNAKGWMQWVSVKRWISDDEVEVEQGIWCCPLGGGAQTVTYEKIDGKWKVQEYGESWVS